MTKLNDMSKLDDYYHFMDTLGGQLSDKQKKIMEELEDKLIEEEILPAISQSVAPVLKSLRNSLTLIVDYNPQNGIIVKTTRNQVKVDEHEAKRYDIPESSNDSAKVGDKRVRRKDKVHWDIRTYKHYSAQLMVKEIDWSTFRSAITIPQVFHSAFEHALNKQLTKGVGVPIKIWVDDTAYDARIIDVKFSDPNRKRCIQITWGAKSPLAKKLQELMPDTYAFMKEEKARNNNAQMIKLPKSLQHEITICAVNEHDGFLFVVQ